MIERAYQQGEAAGLAVWTADEAAPFQTVPYPGTSWQPAGEPARQPHEYFREGTAKLLNLFHPADGQVRMQGVSSSCNAVLHGWMQDALSAILAALPPPAEPLNAAANRAQWERWQEGLTVRVPLEGELPPLGMLLVRDNLAGHKTPSLQRWLVAQGILPVYTPLARLCTILQTKNDPAPESACLAAPPRATAPEYLHVAVNRGWANIPQAQKPARRRGAGLGTGAGITAGRRRIIRHSSSLPHCNFVQSRAQHMVKSCATTICPSYP